MPGVEPATSIAVGLAAGSCLYFTEVVFGVQLDSFINQIVEAHLHFDQRLQVYL